jgi:hypothetical protein
MVAGSIPAAPTTAPIDATFRLAKEPARVAGNALHHVLARV